jgi:hypothetical protein
MRAQIEALHAEVKRLVERLDEAESLLEEAAAFCPRREAFRPMIRDTERLSDLGNRIDAFLSDRS